MNALEVRAALTLAAVYVLRMLGLFMVMPVLAIAAMDYPDYSPLLVGIAIGGYGLTQAALQIPMGMLSDRWGRKPVILLGLTVFAMGSLLAAYADTMTMMIVGRVLQGAGAIAGAIMALATDVSRESQRAKVMAIIGVAIGLSFYIAVLVGPLLAQAFGLSGIFLVTGVLAVLCLPLVKWVVPNGVAGHATADTLPQKQQLRRLITSSQLWRLNVSVLLLHMLITLLFVQLPLTLVNFDMTLDSHWELYLPVLLVSVVLMAMMMRSAKGQTPKQYLVACIVMLGAAFALLALGDHHWWLVIVAVVVFFTGFNYLEANFPALVSSIAPAGEKGTAMGIYASFQFFGAFLGGMLSGLVSTTFNMEVAYGVGAIASALWIVIIIGLRPIAKVKRVTFSVEKQRSDVVAQELSALDGVLDCTIDAVKGIIYLKVNGDFEELKARAITRQ